GKPVVGTDAKPLREGKATLEVVSVLSDHVSQARITSWRDRERDPVLKGDLLFNPAWSPNMRQHVAIAGTVDLTGEGHDDLQELIRTLERQNVIVDAYLDTKELTVKGKGLTRQPDYLNLGEAPDVGNSGIVKEDDPKAKRRTEILATMTKMQEEATRNGVAIISLRKFLAMSGYRAPRKGTSEANGYIHGSLSAG